MFDNGFLVVCRELSAEDVSCGDINVYSKGDNAMNVRVKYTESLREAIGLQLGMLIGAPAEVCFGTIKQETIDKIIDNLNKVGRDRIANKEGECFIFALWAWK